MPVTLTLVGRLGSDPEVRHTENSVIINNSIALDFGYGQNKTSQWVRLYEWKNNDNSILDRTKKDGDYLFGTGSRVIVTAKLSKFPTIYHSQTKQGPAIDFSVEVLDITYQTPVATNKGGNHNNSTSTATQSKKDDYEDIAF